MIIQLNYRDSRPFYQQIKDSIRHLVISRAVNTNEKLPSVRELASSLAINPNTIQRAYHELEDEGYIYTVPGKGCFVSEVKDAKKERRMDYALSQSCYREGTFVPGNSGKRSAGEDPQNF